MVERTPVDEAALLWAAAIIERCDPVALSATVDLGALARIAVASAADDAVDAADPVDRAAALLVGVVTGRPFPASNAAIGWLAATEVLARSGCRVTARPGGAVRLCGDIRSGLLDTSGVAVVLRGWVVQPGHPCPVCGRRVYVLDAAARRLVLPGTEPFELVARCSFEHGVHDRHGRARLERRQPRPEARQPVLARGACGSMLVAMPPGARSIVVTPSWDDPPIVRVGEVDEVHPGDLVGRWDALVERSTTIGFVPADEADVDGHDFVDVDRLFRALHAARPTDDAEARPQGLCEVGAP